MKKPASRVPMYTQIRDYLFDKIKQNEWKPGDYLPSENELSAQFNVSRITVKKALVDLIEDGLIFRVQGKGTFVSNDTAGEPLLYKPLSPADSSEKKLIAFLMPRLDNLYTARILSGIESELSEKGYKLIFCKTHDSQQQEKQIIREMLQLGVQGIIIFPVDGETYSEEILRLTITNFPLVVIDRYLRGIETNCVYSDNANGAYQAVSHLIALGHRNIGLIATAIQGTTSLEDRISGYEQAFAEHGIPIEHRLRLTHFDAEKMNQILVNGVVNEEYREELNQFILQNRDMTAIFGLNSSIGLTVMDAAMSQGIPIPNELSIIFFDYDILPLASVAPTCVSQEEKHIGQEAAKLLISAIANPKQDKQKIIMPTRLVVRGSTGPCLLR